MAQNTLHDVFTQAVLTCLEETFERVHGIYLDKGTSIFETLATLSAEEASQPVGTQCASIAAHVAHMTFYIETLLRFIQGERPQVDWTVIWRTVQVVTPEEWANSQQQLRNAYQTVRTVVQSTPSWEMEGAVNGAMGLLLHNAYHLGEIRQALCTLKPNR
jgi:hypothetical protein